MMKAGEWKSSESSMRGYVSVAGGVLVHLILGTIYCWSNYLSYAPESLMFLDGLSHVGKTPDAVQVMGLALTFQGIGLRIAAELNKKIGERNTSLVGCSLIVLGTYLGSYVTNLKQFFLVYSGLTGLGVGIGFSMPMIAGWSWFPKNKGTVNGVTLFGFGTGSLIFNTMSTNLAQSGVAWGPMLRKLSIAYAFVAAAGVALIKKKPVPANSGPPVVLPGATAKEALSSKRFGLLWLVGFLAFMPGLVLTGLYKRFGMSNSLSVVADDKFLSLVGGLGGLASGLGRVFWGNTVDRIGFQKAYSLTSIIQIVTMLAMPFALGSKAAFLATVCGTLFCLGGSVAMFVTTNPQLFGVKNAAEIYSFLHWALALASVFGAKLATSLLESIGWAGMYKVMAVVSLANIGLLAVLKKESTNPMAWQTKT